MRKKRTCFLTKYHKRKKHYAVLKMIGQANDLEINEILQAVIHRYAAVFPDWEVHFLSLRKDPAKRAEDVDALIRFLKTHGQ